MAVNRVHLRHHVIAAVAALTAIAGAGVLSAIQAAPADAATSSFAYTGGLQSFTVPAGVSAVTITAVGAAGGTGAFGQIAGGRGASMKGVLAVTPGERLAVLVGGNGSIGGGTTGGGGGGSFVWRGTGFPDLNLTSLLVAAGGGGGGTSCTSGQGVNASVNSDGAPAVSGDPGGTGGNGGSSGGAGGGAGILTGGASGPEASGGQAIREGAAGGLGFRATGGFGGGGGARDSTTGGGGGGFSGGGGARSQCPGGGGGGGGSFNAGTNQVNTAGVGIGHGQVLIEFADPTSTELTSSANPSAFGQAVTFTVTVASATGTPTGTVTFTVDGSAMPGCGAVAVTDGVATCTTSSLGIGARAIVATYSGDANHATSSASWTQNVGGLATTVSAAPAFRLNPTYRATLTTTVNGSPLSGRTVMFRVSGVSVCSAVTNASGVATCRTLGLVLFSSAYTASFAGDAAYLPSSGNGAFTP